MLVVARERVLVTSVGNPMAMICGVMYDRSRSNPSSVNLFFFLDTRPLRTRGV